MRTSLGIRQGDWVCALEVLTVYRGERGAGTFAKEISLELGLCRLSRSLLGNPAGTKGF